MKKICVMGLGYIGMPTASILATHGFKVLGVDVNPKIIEAVCNGNTPIAEPGLETLLKTAINSGNLRVTLQPEPSDIFIIAVPTPITTEKKADLQFVKKAAENIVPFLSTGNLVILESTCPPNTTRELLVPWLEQSGLKAGQEFFVVYCPERVLPGQILKELIENSHIIGGIDTSSAEAAKRLYSHFVEGKIYLTDATTAEMVKIMENVYRDVNIALVNELGIICAKLGVNVWEVIELANFHPRVNLHRPGPGVGGHCIPVDPWFIVEKFPQEARIITLSRTINDAMPSYVVKQLCKILRQIVVNNVKLKITILGVSYKGNVDDTRGSPALSIIQALRDENMDLAIYDPHVRDFPYKLSSLTEALYDSDCALVLADHDEFRFLHPQQFRELMRHHLVFDTCNCLKHELWHSSGFDIYLLGAGMEYHDKVECGEKQEED